MITATSGTTGPTSGRGDVTRLHHPLNTDRTKDIADSTLAAANGQATQGSAEFRCPNIHGRYTNISPRSSAALARIGHCRLNGGKWSPNRRAACAKLLDGAAISRAA